MSERQYEHVKVVIVPDPSDQAHVAIMNFTTQGRGNYLPPGAAWIEPGWWIRAPEPALIEGAIRRWRELENPNKERHRPPPLRWFIAKDEDVPTDRTYRNAQVAHESEPRVVHHMPLARELHRDMLRTERVEKMLALDKEWIIAQRTKADVADIDAEKQLLLDSTDDPRIEAATTIDELKAVTLDRIVQEAAARGDIQRARTVAVDAVP